MQTVWSGCARAIKANGDRVRHQSSFDTHCSQYTVCGRNHGMTLDIPSTQLPGGEKLSLRYGPSRSRPRREGKPQWSVTAVCSST
jgi:hypothetical protein